ncbi:MAG: glutaminase [bacterium]|nr:glutaminase [bacterium]
MATDGVNPENGERLISSWVARTVKTIMLTCGMYDGSREFAVLTGIPTKSGVKADWSALRLPNLE